MSLNLVLVTVIFFVLLVIVAIFVAQQFATVQKTSAKKSLSLTEKLAASGINPLDSDRFREIALRAGPSEEDPKRLVALSGPDISDRPASFGPEQDDRIEKPEETAFTDPNLSTELQHIEKKDLQALYSEYLIAKNLNPFDVEPEFKLGMAYLRNAQYEKSQGLFQKVVESKPEFPGIFYYLGEAYRCNGQFYEAMQAYKQSWEMDHLGSQTSTDSEHDSENDNSEGV
ncbi:MAG: tetratricopeptide repeat protein [Candidatus Glassbacteria bacterium]|nr:tetratricopeptide repeat protein [Candidatus Glassbacteria bacterium]